MKQKLLKLSMLIGIMLMGINAWGGTWTRCTAVSDLIAGGTFIIGYEATANSGVIVPMQNTGTATTSTAGLLYSGTTSGSTGSGTIDMSSVTETSLYEVTIAASTTVDGAITIKCGDNYVGNTNTKNNLKLFASEATTTSFTPTVGTNDVFTLKIAANASYTTLQYNSSNPRFSVYSGTQKNVVIYKKVVKSLSSLAISGTPTKTTYEAGDAFDPAGLVVTGTYSDASTAAITDGITWTLDPETLSSGNTSVDVTATVGTVSSTKTTISGLTVNAASKTLKDIDVEGNSATFWKGDTFNHDGKTVNATWDDGTITDVTDDATFSTPDMSTAGEKEVTVTYKGKTATYIINVQTIANTQETAYTVAQIKAIVDAKKDLSTQVYVKGIVSKIAYAYSSTNKNLSFYISDDGTTTSQQFECYKTAADTDPNVSVGDVVIAYGTATVFGSTYEFTEGNKIISHSILSTASIADIAIAKGETITPEITTNISGSYTVKYESSNTDIVAVSNDNKLSTGTKTGTATITATISADGYSTTTTTFTVTVTSDATLKSITISGNLTNEHYYVGDDFDFSGLTATGNYSDESTANLSSTVTWTVEPTKLSAGFYNVTVKATSGEISGTKEYEVIVSKKEATIAIEDMEIGKTATNVSISATTDPENATLKYEITEGSDYITLTDGKISAKAVGTATIKASYAGTEEYESAETTFSVTVNSWLFYESFDINTGTGGNDNSWSGTIASETLASDNSGWTFVNGNGANKCAKFGTSKKAGSAQTPAITLTGAAKITFKAGTWDGDAATLNLSATSGTLSQSSVTISNAEFTEYTVYITGVESSTKITFAAAQASKNRFFLDEVKVEEAIIETRATAKDAYGTICLPYAFTATGATVYSVTGITDGKLTLSTVETPVAGTPYIYQATADAQTFACTGDAATDPVANTYLTGVFADTKITSGYVLQTQSEKQAFYVVNSEITVPAYKAYLNASAVPGVKMIGFDTNEADAINAVNVEKTVNGAIYNLNGQKISKLQKGINIVNGKKYFVK